MGLASLARSESINRPIPLQLETPLVAVKKKNSRHPKKKNRREKKIGNTIFRAPTPLRSPKLQRDIDRSEMVASAKKKMNE